MTQDEKRAYHNAYMKEWYARNPEKYEEHKRRARERSARLRAEDPERARKDAARVMRAWRAANPEHQRALAKASRERAVARAREYVDSIKESTPCMDCGQFFPSVCMDFDHVSGKKPSMLRCVSRMAGAGQAIETLAAEIAKCELVCSNCHRLRTAARLKRKDSAMTLEEVA